MLDLLLPFPYSKKEKNHELRRTKKWSKVNKKPHVENVLTRKSEASVKIKNQSLIKERSIFSYINMKLII